jgi:hypothetical protein
MLKNDNATLQNSREVLDIIDINIPNVSDRNRTGLEFNPVSKLQYHLSSENPMIEQDFISQSNAIIEYISNHETKSDNK